jgi:DNA-binding transcriptional LysR family regulator
MRHETSGALYAWEFEKDGQALRVRVDGQLGFNNSYPMIDAAMSGFGIAYVPESIVQTQLASGALEQVLDDWSPLFDGYFLYYPAAARTSWRPRSSSTPCGTATDEGPRTGRGECPLLARSCPSPAAAASLIASSC